MWGNFDLRHLLLTIGGKPFVFYLSPILEIEIVVVISIIRQGNELSFCAFSLIYWKVVVEEEVDN
jgi:hypothetical protein